MDEDELAARRLARRRKSGWKRPRRIWSLWARVGMAGAMIFVTAFLAVNLVAKVARPYREASLQSTQLSLIRQQSDVLESENTALVRRIAYLKTSQGVAAEARKMGYLRPGEIPMVVEGSVSQMDGVPDSAPTQLPSRSSSPTFRFWQHLTGH